MTTRFILFTKDSCGPCGLVKRYFNALKDDRTNLIEEVQLEDVSDVPIPEENLALAKTYGVTATPVLIIADGSGELLETYVGGVPITQNIRKLWTKYDV
jgi:thioredoxin-related protein